MATQISGEVFQDALRTLGDGNAPPFPQLRMGVPPVADKWDLFALQGRMFNLQETTTGTALTAAVADATSNVLTIPSMRMTIPTGWTMFPYRFNIAWEARAGTITEGMIIASETDSFSATGTILTPTNWRTDNPRASALTRVYNGSGDAIVEGALTRPRSLFKWAHTHAIAAVEPNNLDKVWDVLWPIVGPATLLFYLGSVTTEATYIFGFDWAEIPTVSAITAV